MTRSTKGKTSRSDSSPYKFSLAMGVVMGLIRKLRIALGFLTLSLLLGMGGFVLLEGYSLVDAFYMTIITVSTVGYGEVQPLSDSGKVFASFLIITNFGLFFYAISQLTAFFVEGDASELVRKYRIEKEIDQLTNHIVVCGYGRNGREIIRELRAEGRAFIVLENRENTLKLLEQEEGVLYIEGDATKDHVLQRARVSNAAALITTLPSDADNVYTVLAGREANPQLSIISRASQESSESKLRRAGCDHVVMPEKIGGAHMATMVLKPDIMVFINLIARATGGASFYFEEFVFEDIQSKYHGKSLDELNIGSKTGANLLGLKTPDGRFEINPSGRTILRPQTKLIILGNQEQIQASKRLLLSKEDAQ